MNLSIEQAVGAFLFILGAAAIFAAAFWLVTYIESKWPCEVPIYNALRVLLAVAAFVVFVGVVLSLMGHPIHTHFFTS